MTVCPGAVRSGTVKFWLFSKLKITTKSKHFELIQSTEAPIQHNSRHSGKRTCNVASASDKDDGIRVFTKGDTLRVINLSFTVITFSI